MSSPDALGPSPAIGKEGKEEVQAEGHLQAGSWLGPAKAVPFPALTWGRGAAHQPVLGISVVGVAILIDDDLQPQGVGVAHHCLGWGRGGDACNLLGPGGTKGCHWGLTHRRPRAPSH